MILSLLYSPPPVVLLHPTPPSKAQWAELTVYGDVWYIPVSLRMMFALVVTSLLRICWVSGISDEGL